MSRSGELRSSVYQVREEHGVFYTPAGRR
jgi:hypothetical protein